MIISFLSARFIEIVMEKGFTKTLGIEKEKKKEKGGKHFFQIFLSYFGPDHPYPLFLLFSLPFNNALPFREGTQRLHASSFFTSVYCLNASYFFFL